MDAATQKRMEEDIAALRETWMIEFMKRPGIAPVDEDHNSRTPTRGPASPRIRPAVPRRGDLPKIVPSKRQFQDGSDANQQGTPSHAQSQVGASEIPEAPEGQVRRKFVVGLDYGTTYTSVSYSSSGPKFQVPSESWYPSAPAERGRFLKESVLEDDISDVDDETIADDSSSEYTDSEYMDDRMLDDDDSKEYLWGYAVFYQEYIACTTRRGVGLVKRAKSKLLDSVHTQQDRQSLDPVLDELLRRKTIRKFGKKNTSPSPRDIQDVVTHYLIKVFAHTKQQLTAFERYDDQCEVQLVATVPTVWSSQSSRVLQASMEAALRATKLGALQNGSINNLFIISEPEAAAAFLLASTENILAGESFIILDAGGGTVDVVTYTVASAYPLRIEKEEITPDGDNCGASYLNQNFKTLLEDRLKDEFYLFTDGDTAVSIANRQIPRFEEDFKREVRISKQCGHKLYIKGLIGDEQAGRYGSDAKRFEANRLILTTRDYRIIFRPLLDRVQAVLAKQLRRVHENGKAVKKVFLVGGFGEAPSLKDHLRNYLEEESGKLGREIKLLTREDHKQDCATVVSAGAVLRAHNLDGGPKRFAQSSYGFLRTEPYEPSAYDGHKGAKFRYNAVDQERYVQTILYFLLKGDLVSANHIVEPIVAYHTFTITEKHFLCEEVLYVSDSATKSHYPRVHAKNKDAQVAGKIIVDMTFLRDRKYIKPTLPPSGFGKKFYKVEYELVAFVEGRNLRYEARYPPGGTGTVQGTAQVSISAAFLPGTG